MGLELVGDKVTHARLVADGHWLADLRSVDVPVTSLAPAPPVVLGLLEQVVRTGADLRPLAKGGNALSVEFPAAVRRGLADGSLHLMQTSTGAAPIAVNAGGEIVKQARVVGLGAGAAGAGALGVISWPILLVGAVGLAAAVAERRWLEVSFGKLEAGLARIETRMRDDDLGELEAANALIELVRPDVGAGSVPDQLVAELAAHRANVEGIYRSRRRFARRFTAELFAAQDVHAEKKGESKGWVKDVVDELGDADGGSADELVVFVQSMVVRARLASATSAVLATGGDGGAALRLLDQIESETREDYWALQRPISALAKHQPEPALTERIRGRLPLGAGVSERERAAALVAVLDSEMRTNVGDQLPERGASVAITVPSESVLELSP